MDKGNTSKDENPPLKREEKKGKEEEERAGPSSPETDSKIMQPVESSALEKDDESAIEAIRRYMAEKLGFSEGKKAEESKKKEGGEVTLLALPGNQANAESLPPYNTP